MKSRIIALRVMKSCLVTNEPTYQTFSFECISFCLVHNLLSQSCTVGNLVYTPVNGST